MTRAAIVLVGLLAATPALAAESYLLEKGSSEDGPTESAATFVYSDRFAVMSVAISGDGRDIAAAALTSPEGVKAWALKDAEGRGVPRVSGSASHLAYANSGPRIAVAVAADALSGREGMIELSDLSTGRPGPALRGADDVRAIAFSPDDQVVLAALPEGVRAWDLREGSSRDLLRLRGGADTVSFTSAEEAYVSAAGGAMIYRVQIPDGRVLEQWKGKRVAGPVAISSDGGLLAAADGTGLIKIHDLAGDSQALKVDVGGPITAMTWATSGGRLAVGTKSGEVRVYDIPEAGSLPRGFRDTPPLNGRGGGVIGAWDGEPDRSAGRDDGSRDPEGRDLRIDRSESNGQSIRLDLDLGRGGERVGDGATKAAEPNSEDADRRKERPRASNVTLRPRVLVLDQMGGDPRAAEDLEEALVKNLARLKPCWRRAQRAGDSVLGRLVFEMGVSPEGEGVAIESPLEDTTGSEKLLSCLEERLRESLFGPGLGSMDIRLELDLVEAR